MANGSAREWSVAWSRLDGQGLLDHSESELKQMLDAVVDLARNSGRYSNHGNALNSALGGFDADERPEIRGSTLAKGFENLVRIVAHLACLQTRENERLVDCLEELRLLDDEASPKRRWGDRKRHWSEWFEEPPTERSIGEAYARRAVAVAYFVRNKATHENSHVDESAWLEELCSGFLLVLDRAWEGLRQAMAAAVFPSDIERGQGFVQAVVSEYDTRRSAHITRTIEADIIQLMDEVVGGGGYVLLEGGEGAGKSCIAMSIAAAIQERFAAIARRSGLETAGGDMPTWLPGSLLHSMKAGRRSAQIFESLAWQAARVLPDSGRIESLLDPRDSAVNVFAMDDRSEKDRSGKGESDQRGDSATRRPQGLDSIEQDQSAVFGDSMDQLSGRLSELLQIVAEARGRCFVVIDALDESTEGEDLVKLFPDELPANVCVLLTARSESPVIEAIQRRLRPRMSNVGPLVPDEVDDFIARSRHQTTIDDSVRDRLKGHRTTPLLLLAALDSDDPAELPDSNRVIFEQWFESWLDHEVPLLGQADRGLDVLDFLALSARGDFVSLEAIQSFLRTSMQQGSRLPRIFEIRKLLQERKSQVLFTQRGHELRCRLELDGFAHWTLCTQQSLSDLDDFLRRVCEWSLVEELGLPTLSLLVRCVIETGLTSEDALWSRVAEHLMNGWSAVPSESRRRALEGLDPLLQAQGSASSRAERFLNGLAGSCGYAGAALGEALKTGRLGFERSQERAVACWIESVEHDDNHRARRGLANAICEGGGVVSEPMDAVEHFEKAIEMGDDLAKLQFARRLLDGAGVLRHRERGLALLHEGMEGSDPRFEREYANRLVTGRGVFPEVEEGLRRLQGLADAGDHAAARDLGQYRCRPFRPHFDEYVGRRYLEMAADAGLASAHRILGHLHLRMRFHDSSPQAGIASIVAAGRQGGGGFGLGEMLWTIATRLDRDVIAGSEFQAICGPGELELCLAFNDFWEDRSPEANAHLWSCIWECLRSFSGFDGSGEASWLVGDCLRFGIDPEILVACIPTLEELDESNVVLLEVGRHLTRAEDPEHRRMGRRLLDRASRVGMKTAIAILASLDEKHFDGPAEVDPAIERLLEGVKREERWALRGARSLVERNGYRSSEFPTRLELLRRGLAQGDGPAGVELVATLLSNEDSSRAVTDAEITNYLRESVMCGHEVAGFIAHALSLPKADRPDSRIRGFTSTLAPATMSDPMLADRVVELGDDHAPLLRSASDGGVESAETAWIEFLASRREESDECRAQLFASGVAFVRRISSRAWDSDYHSTLELLKAKLDSDEWSALETVLEQRIRREGDPALIPALRHRQFDCQSLVACVETLGEENAVARAIAGDPITDLEPLDESRAAVVFLASTRLRQDGFGDGADRLLLLARRAFKNRKLNALFLDRQIRVHGVRDEGVAATSLADYEAPGEDEDWGSLWKANVGLCHAVGFLVKADWGLAVDEFKGLSRESLEWWFTDLRRVGDPEADLVELLWHRANEREPVGFDEIAKRLSESNLRMPPGWG